MNKKKKLSKKQKEARDKKREKVESMPNRSEEKVKNFNSDKFYEVTNISLAEYLISLNKWMYFVEIAPHWKYTERTMTVYYFEYTREIHLIAKKWREENIAKRKW